MYSNKIIFAQYTPSSESALPWSGPLNLSLSERNKKLQWIYIYTKMHNSYKYKHKIAIYFCMEIAI